MLLKRPIAIFRYKFACDFTSVETPYPSPAKCKKSNPESDTLRPLM